MKIRDAVEADAEAMASIADAPETAMTNLIHDRTVRVAELDESPETEPHVDAPETDADLLGFVSFDARRDTVHVTQLAGIDEACEQLLGEPVRFARLEGMDVELLVPDSNPELGDVAERVGFDRRGRGPRFDGTSTVRYRFEG